MQQRNKNREGTFFLVATQAEVLMEGRQTMMSTATGSSTSTQNTIDAVPTTSSPITLVPVMTVLNRKITICAQHHKEA